MPSSILHIKPEDIDSIEKRQKHTISIVGCGRIGVLHACLFADAGFKVVGWDADQVVTKYLARGRTPFLRRDVQLLLRKHIKNGNLKFTNDVKTSVSQSDVVVVTTSVKTDGKKKTNYSDLERVCKGIGSNLQKGSLVIVTSVVGIGVTGELIKETLENTSGFKVGVDLGLAYSPLRVLGKETLKEIAGHKRIVASADQKSLDATSTFLEVIGRKGVIKIGDIRTAEAAVLFGAVHNEINFALANEFALFCEKVGIDYLEAQRLAQISEYDALALPTFTYGNIHKAPYLLLEEAENSNARLRISKIAKEINEEILKHVTSLIRKALRECGKTLRRAKISLLGVSRTPNMKDAPKESIKMLASMLKTKGAKISLYDPYLSSRELEYLGHPFKKSLKRVVEGVDCIVILTSHDQFKRLNLRKLKVMTKMPAAIVDLEGVIRREKAEREGFVYLGLGRGV